MDISLQQILFVAVLVTGLSACGGYKAADEDDLEPRAGEIVGILVDERGKTHPDASVELYAADGTSALQHHEGMDSDGRFGIFPPDTGIYNVVGILGETDKVIVQNIQFTAGVGQSIGKISTRKVGGLSFRVLTPESVSAEDITVELLGYAASTSTKVEGVGLIETGIPAGTYKLRLDKEELESRTLENIKVEAEAVTVLDNISMSIKQD